MHAGGLQGFMVDKATADANGIVTLADIGDNPDIAALFDTDGNGKADLFGCNDGWGCQIVINDTIALNGWEDTIQQISADYSALWLDVLAATIEASRSSPTPGRPAPTSPSWCPART